MWHFLRNRFVQCNHRIILRSRKGASDVYDFTTLLEKEEAGNLASSLVSYLKIRQEDFDQLVRHTGQLYRIYCNNTTVGFIWYLDHRNSVLMYAFVLQEIYCDKGIGKEALTQFVKEMQGKESIQTFVHRSKDTTIAFFQRFGFQEKSYDEGSGFYRLEFKVVKEEG